jgi:hypothetical protein
MTTMTQTNGRTERKSLAEQIDRLDGILDGLADGLNEAVVTAAQEAVTVAVRQAVQAVLTEVLTNPDLLAVLRGPLASPGPAASPPPAAASGEPQPEGWLRRAGAWLRRQWSCACRTTAALAGLGGRAVVSGWQLLRRFRGQVLLAMGVGAAAGVGAYLAGPWLAAGAAWLGGFATTLAVQAGLALRRALAAVSFAAT